MRFCAGSTAVTPVSGSGCKRAATLAAPVGHDCPSCPSPHPQPKAMHAGSAPVVRLEGPLALRHHSLLVASGIAFRPRNSRGRTRLPARSPQQALCLAGNRRGPRVSPLGSQPYRRLSGDCSRVLTSLRRVKPGSPRPPIPLAVVSRAVKPRPSNQSISGVAFTGFTPPPPRRASHVTKARPNVPERLAPAPKTVSFGQCRFRLKRRPTTKRGWRTGSLPRQPLLPV